MQPPLPEGYVAHFPPSKTKLVPHIFCDPLHMPADQSPSGHEESSRICAVCGARRVTIMPKDAEAYREWREASGMTLSALIGVGCTRGGVKA